MTIQSLSAVIAKIFIGSRLLTSIFERYSVVSLSPLELDLHPGLSL